MLAYMQQFVHIRVLDAFLTASILIKCAKGRRRFSANHRAVVTVPTVSPQPPAHQPARRCFLILTASDCNAVLENGQLFAHDPTFVGQTRIAFRLHMPSEANNVGRHKAPRGTCDFGFRNFGI